MLELPARSVEVALTEIRPSPSVGRSAETKVTATGEPVPVTVFVNDPPPERLNVTTILAPLSPLTVITPEA